MIHSFIKFMSNIYLIYYFYKQYLTHIILMSLIIDLINAGHSNFT